MLAKPGISSGLKGPHIACPREAQRVARLLFCGSHCFLLLLQEAGVVGEASGG